MSAGRHSLRRGVTLIEVLIVLALLAAVSGGAMFGLGAIGTAKLRQSATLITSAVRVAYTHASQTGKPTRLVFDFEKGSIAIEQAKGRHFVQAQDRTGGAEAAMAGWLANQGHYRRETWRPLPQAHGASAQIGAVGEPAFVHGWHCAHAQYYFYHWRY